MNTVYVVTGANRGIGLGLVRALYSRPSITVVATVRNEKSRTALEAAIGTDKPGNNSLIFIMCIDYSTAPSPRVIRDSFLAATDNQVSHVDVLICNAGFATSMQPCLQVEASELRADFEVNTIGPLMTFQGLWPLMQSRPKPKFLVISSSVGSIEDMEPLPGGSYGPSKAAVNWITRSLHFQFEKEGLVSAALHPGWVDTNMGVLAAEAWEYGKAPPVSVDDSVRGLLDVIDRAERNSFSGRFVTEQGEFIHW